jgi:cytochrome c oxidase subunit 5a
MVMAEEKTENDEQYQQYVTETKPLREELGILIREELYLSDK